MFYIPADKKSPSKQLEKTGFRYNKGVKVVADYLVLSVG